MAPQLSVTLSDASSRQSATPLPFSPSVESSIRDQDRQFFQWAVLLVACDLMMLAIFGGLVGLMICDWDVITAHGWQAIITAQFAVTVLYLLLGIRSDVYSVNAFTAPYDATFRVLWVWAVAVALELAVGLVQRDAAAFPLPWLLGWGLAGAAGLAASRILLARRMSDMYDTGRLARRVAIVGAVAEMEALLGYLSHQDRSKEWDVVGLFAVGPPAVVSGKPVRTLEDLIVWAPALRLDSSVGRAAGRRSRGDRLGMPTLTRASSRCLCNT